MRAPLALSGLFLLASVAMGEEGDGRDRGRDERRHSEAEELAKFDADGDKRLNEEEADARDREHGRHGGRGGQEPDHSRAEAVAAIRLQYDADQDGILQRTEAVLLARAMMRREQPIIAQYDSNGDGSLKGPAETLRMRRDLTPLLLEHLRQDKPELFRVLDQDADGRLDHEEIMRGSSLLRAEKEGLFEGGEDDEPRENREGGKDRG
jgi:EF hand